MALLPKWLLTLGVAAAFLLIVNLGYLEQTLETIALLHCVNALNKATRGQVIVSHQGEKVDVT